MTSDEGTTNDERRVTSEEGLSPAMGGQESALSPAMREWRRKLAAGYSIRPRLRVGRKGQAYLEWGPALYNPEGSFVQNVRRDTLRKLMRLGLLTDGAGAAQARDVDDDAHDSASVGDSGRCVDRNSE